MKILLDVNILVRANEMSDGPARKLLVGLIERRHILLTSAEILMELVRVLRYPRVQALYGLSEQRIYEYIQFLKQVCVLVPTSLSRDFPIRDVADTSVLKAAVIGEADFICTLDKDFYAADVITFCSLMGIVVLDDVALGRRLYT